jgi:hypothetical protein
LEVSAHVEAADAVNVIAVSSGPDVDDSLAPAVAELTAS